MEQAAIDLAAFGDPLIITIGLATVTTWLCLLLVALRISRSITTNRKALAAQLGQQLEQVRIELRSVHGAIQSFDVD